MKPFPPNINPQLFAISAVAVGAVLIDNFTVDEQNSISNWLMLVGQYITTSAAQQQLIEGRQSLQQDQNKDQSNNDNKDQTNESDKKDQDKNDQQTCNESDKASSDDESSMRLKKVDNVDEFNILLEMIDSMRNEIESLRLEVRNKTKRD